MPSDFFSVPAIEVSVLFQGDQIVGRPLFTRIIVPLLLVAASSAWHHAHAQAWVEDKGSLDLGLDYNLGISDHILGDNGMTFPNSGITTHQMTLEATYVPVSRLAVDVGLPYALLQYNGDKKLYVHPGGGAYDDGNLHGTFTDLAARVRYQLPIDAVAIAPHLGFSLPVADYENVGNAVPGRHLKALHVGLELGKIFLDTFYVNVGYDFALVEKYDKTANTKAYGQNTSDVNFTLGDKLLDGKLDINVDAQYHTTHGGVSFNTLPTLPADVVLYHDPILHETIVLVGGGIGYSITDKLDIAAAIRFFVDGANTQNANVYGLSLTYSVL